MFTTKHIIVLAILAVIFALGLIFIKKISLKVATKVMLLIGICSEIIKVFYYIMTNEAEYGGYLPKTDLPFHLCSIQIIFLVVLVLSNNEKLKRLLMAFMVPTCLIGGFCAIMIPTSSSINGMLILTIQYFGYHIAIMLFAVKILQAKEIEFTVKDYKNALIFLGAFLFIAIYLNSWINDYVHNINFMYVVNPPVDGLPFLNKNQGWLVYILRYALIAVVAFTACYARVIVKAIKGKKKK